VQIDLREYQKKGDPKVSIDQIKNDFLQDLKSIGIPDSAVSIASYEGYSGHIWWVRKKKDPELYATISYQIKFNNSYKLDELVPLLDDEATQNFQVVRTSHSKIMEFKKQLKILAVKAAKEKAVYLTEAINEKVGEAITIAEPADISTYYYSSGRLDKDKYGNVQVQGATQQSGIDFKRIKLKFDVNVLFALK
jgi:predicted DNA-binding protein